MKKDEIVVMGHIGVHVGRVGYKTTNVVGEKRKKEMTGGKDSEWQRKKGNAHTTSSS